MITEIQKGKGIEGLVRPASVEETRQLESTGNNIAEVLNRFHEVILDEEMMCIPEDFDYILEPHEINSALQASAAFEEDRNYNFLVGMFVGKLIQNSYDAGNNGFKITLPSPIGNVSQNIQGYKKRIKVEIHGVAGYDCGRGIHCANIKVYGELGYRFGVHASYSTLTLHGEIPEDSHCGLEAKRCRFKTDNEETLQTFRNLVPKNNRVIFIHSDGKEEVIRDYK